MKSNMQSVESAHGTITLVTLNNKSGAWVVLSSLGAGIVSVNVPDARGNVADVVLGYENPADFMADGPCAGKIPGRYANRIANGKFSLDKKEYTLPVNNGPNHLHGGPDGFQNKIWQVNSVTENSVEFSIKGDDGEAGYPGVIVVKARYTWSDDNELTLDLTAESDAPTVVNLTNHAYFNLSGHDSGTVLKHRLQLNASNYLPTDDTLIPEGGIAPVAGTPMDFTTERFIGERIKDDFPALRYGKGYDNCWVIDNYEEGNHQPVARLTDLESGRVLEVSTTQPGVQVYTGNWLDGCPVGKGGAVYHDYDGVAIECQGFPDAPNHDNFPSQVLRPGQTYRQKIAFRFSTLMNEAK